MGQGGRIQIANATKSTMNRTYVHSYQMNAWNTSFPAQINANENSSSYVEFDENIFDTTSDDAGECDFSLPSGSIEFQARFDDKRDIKAVTKVFDRQGNLAIGVIQDGAFDTKSIPEWNMFASAATYNMGWNHDGVMSIAFLDLSLILSGDDLTDMINAITSGTLSNDQAQQLQSAACLLSGLVKPSYNYDVTSINYSSYSVAPKKSQTQIGVKSNIDLSESSTVDQSINFSKEIDNSFTLSFTETLSIEDSIEISAGVPDVVSVKDSIKMTMSVSAGQSKTQTTKSDYAINTSVTLVGPGVFAIQGFVSINDGGEIPFTLQANVKLTVEGKSIPGSIIANLLKTGLKTLTNGFDGKVVSVEDDNAVVAVTGNLTGAFGVETFFDITKNDKGKITTQLHQKS